MYSPNDLISPKHHSIRSKTWFLLLVLIKSKPAWAVKHTKKKHFIFREIAYVNSDNELIGLGRSYLPINYFGISILFSCLFFHPKPLGVVLAKKFGHKINIEVISDNLIKNNLSPYKIGDFDTQSYKRIIRINKNNAILVEEDFLK